MKVILGGGLTALLARDILGDGWTIVPVGRSRFYSFNPPLADNFVIKGEAVDEYMERYAVMPYLYRIGYSYGGQILFNTALTLEPYLNKLYGDYVPLHAYAYWSNRIDFFGYGNCSNMYMDLQDKYKNDILKNAATYGIPHHISEHTIETDKGKFAYERIISTVPLYVLLEWMGITWYELLSKDLYCYHVRTDSLDFEGATHLFVVDPEIEFYKVTMLNRLNYIFFANKQIEFPGRCFMSYIKRYELIAETSVERAICCGPIPQITELDDADIVCIGKSAVWDDCLDISSSIKRLIKMQE